IYLMSLKLRPSKHDFVEVKRMGGCGGFKMEDECETVLLAMINAASIGGADASSIYKTLEMLSSESEPDYSTCQAKLELAYLITAVQEILRKPANKAEVAAYAIERIKKEGGIRMSLKVAACEQYFFDNPH
uniref:hypothetical protein n=1 Tax=Pseudomonas viridiflava TaxID=33069 RepID=UPI0013CEC96E